MISILVSLVLAILFACFVIFLFRENQLTVRGTRVVFILIIVVGFFLFYVTSHIVVDCDVRVSNYPCQISWL